MKKNKRRHLKKSVKYIFILILIVFAITNFYPKINNYILNLNMGEEISDKSDSSNINIENINLDDSLSTLDKLKELSKYENKINDIIDNYDKYPELLLEMLARDLDMLDFVIDYPQKFGNIYSDNVGNIKRGEIPLLIQWDERWGYGKYGDSSIAISGCGPTALSMVIVGLTGDNTMTPSKIAKFSEENGFFLSSSGTSWDLMTIGARKLGIKSNELPLSKNSIFSALKSGHPIICSMRAGDFTTTGHFIVLVGIEDGKIKVNDPNSKKRSKELWEYERLQHQIKNLWEFSK